MNLRLKLVVRIPVNFEWNGFGHESLNKKEEWIIKHCMT